MPRETDELNDETPTQRAMRRAKERHNAELVRGALLRVPSRAPGNRSLRETRTRFKGHPEGEEPNWGEHMKKA